MMDFVRNHILCVVLVFLGLLLVIGNYYLILSNRRRKTHVSGIPFLGGLMIALGFLTTPYKYFALLGLLDPTICGLFISIYYGKNESTFLKKRYDAFLFEKHLSPELSRPDLKIVSVIHYENRETPHEQEFPYITNRPFQIGYPWVVILVAEEPAPASQPESSTASEQPEVSGSVDAPAPAGKRFLILDTGTDGNLKKLDPEKIRILPFDDGKIELHDIADFLKGDVSIRVEKADPSLPES